MPLPRRGLSQEYTPNCKVLVSFWSHSSRECDPSRMFATIQPFNVCRLLSSLRRDFLRLANECSFRPGSISRIFCRYHLGDTAGRRVDQLPDGRGSGGRDSGRRRGRRRRRRCGGRRGGRARRPGRQSAQPRQQSRLRVQGQFSNSAISFVFVSLKLFIFSFSGTNIFSNHCSC